MRLCIQKYAVQVLVFFFGGGKGDIVLKFSLQSYIILIMEKKQYYNFEKNLSLPIIF